MRSSSSSSCSVQSRTEPIQAYRLLIVVNFVHMAHRIEVARRDLRAAIARTLWAIGPAASASAASAAAAAIAAPEPAAASTAAVVEQEINPQEHGIQADVPDDFPCIPAAAATTAILAEQSRRGSDSQTPGEHELSQHRSTPCQVLSRSE